MARRGGGQNTGEPSQRQLRAGELIRHALVDVLSREELHDVDLQGVMVTIGEVRCSPDLRHANIFCSPLGASSREQIEAVSEALNRAAGFLRGKLGRQIEMKFTPQLHFIPDHSYDDASEMDAVFRRAEVARDLDDSEDQDEAEG
ncbi:30S ribosome-binding factor RbfA [Hyphomonas sp. FCG-A18]|jgi:ribosome-binding factor A|uniref:30S ribosome-binding factor RbfA n=1 Tax=Hyphomonas sp. FCG-A18 TaxID=3080019 RepID=UPI002B2BC496|nr:30S ribosome-binding factor RbfA [Hyphomonas sp. FCG-A18]